MILLKKPYTPVNFVGETKTFNVYGKSFFNIKNIYLQGQPYIFKQTLQNPFSAVPRLSALYPAFNAIKLDPSQYTSNNDNTLTFIMPSAERGGFVDIILENAAGYGALTQYVIKDTFNPYPSGSPEYNAYEPYIKPWANGINVLDIRPDRKFYILTIDDILIKNINSTGYIIAIPTDEDPNAVMSLNDELITAFDGSDIVQIT
jgi:hypothetical protein